MSKTLRSFYVAISAIILFFAIGTGNIYSYESVKPLLLVSYDSLKTGSINDEIAIHAKVENVGTTKIALKLKVNVIDLAPTHMLLICYGITCYPPISEFGEKTFPDAFDLLAGKDSGNDFKCTVEQGGGGGVTILEFTFFDQNDPTTSVTFQTKVDISTSVKDEILADNGISIAPNPAKDNLNILFTNSKLNINELRIYDATGSVVLTSNINSGLSLESANISSLQSGVYNVAFLSDGVVKSVKKISVIK